MRVLPEALLHAFGVGYGNYFFRAAVDRIMQLDALEREVVTGLDGYADFFNGVDAGIRAGMRNLHGGRVIDARFDEIILAQANAFALFLGRKMIHAIFLYGHLGR